MGKMNPEKLVRFVLDLFFPPRCVFCGEIVPPGTQICRKCSEEIRPSLTFRLMDLPLKGENIRCVFLYPYEGKVRDSILRFKFHGGKENAEFYARRLAEQVRSTFPAETFDYVTSVPLSAERKKERGYNQSELIAEKLAKELGLSYRAVLEKIRVNRVQHLLSRIERAENVKGAYRVAEKKIADKKKILLVDDIVTTGYTLAECASVLLHDGAASVSCAAVAGAVPEKVEKEKPL